MINDYVAISFSMKGGRIIDENKTLPESHFILRNLGERRASIEVLLERVRMGKHNLVEIFPLESEEELRMMSGRYGPMHSKRAGRRGKYVNAQLRGQNMKVQQYRADKTLLHSPGVSL